MIEKYRNRIRKTLQAVEVPYRLVGGREAVEPMPDHLVELLVPIVADLVNVELELAAKEIETNFVRISGPEYVKRSDSAKAIRKRKR